MKLLRHYDFRVARRDSVGELFRSVTAGFEKFGIVPRCSFYLEEFPLQKVSPVDRLVKHAPEFEPFKIPAIDSEDPLIGHGPVLTNLDSSWNIGHAIPPTIDIPINLLAEVADGIPRKFPFYISNFMFHGIDLLDASRERHAAANRRSTFAPRSSARLPAQLPNRCVGPAIVIASRSWQPHRDTTLEATVCVPAPPDNAESLPDIPAGIQTLLDEIGTASQMAISIEPAPEGVDPKTGRPPKLDALWTRYDDGIWCEGIVLPHRIPSAEEVGHFGNWKIGPMKSVLLEVFNPLEFQYQNQDSGQGMYVMTKPTSRNNMIELSIDIGSYSRSALFGLTLHGFRHWIHVSIPAGGKQSNQSSYAILSIENWRQMLENVAVLVQHLERTFVVEAEEILGRSPRWSRGLNIC